MDARLRLLVTQRSTVTIISLFTAALIRCVLIRSRHGARRL